MFRKPVTRALSASSLVIFAALASSTRSGAQYAFPGAPGEVANAELQQEVSAILLPDAPGFVPFSSSAAQGVGGQQTVRQPGPPSNATPPEQGQPKRIFFIIPNYRSVNAGVKLPPQSPFSKFVTASQDTFDYSALTLSVLVATESYVTTATPEFGRGGLGFSRYLWHSYVDQAAENYVVEFVVPVLTHEDTRFYTLGKGSGGHRLVYALTRAFVTRADDGHETFNASEVVGAGVAAGLSNLYYPHGERTVKNTLDKYATSIGIDAASFVLREFDGDIYRKFAKKHGAATP